MPTKTKAKPRPKAKLIVRDKDILGGMPVFAGTRVPIKNLFDCLKPQLLDGGFSLRLSVSHA